MDSWSQFQRKNSDQTCKEELNPEFFSHNRLFLDANICLILFGCVNSFSA